MWSQNSRVINVLPCVDVKVRVVQKLFYILFRALSLSTQPCLHVCSKLIYNLRDLNVIQPCTTTFITGDRRQGPLEYAGSQQLALNGQAARSTSIGERIRYTVLQALGLALGWEKGYHGLPPAGGERPEPR